MIPEPPGKRPAAGFERVNGKKADRNRFRSAFVSVRPTGRSRAAGRGQSVILPEALGKKIRWVL